MDTPIKQDKQMTENGFDNYGFSTHSFFNFRWEFEESFSGYLSKNSLSFDNRLTEYKGGRDWFYCHFDAYNEAKNR